VAGTSVFKAANIADAIKAIRGNNSVAQAEFSQSRSSLFITATAFLNCGDEEWVPLVVLRCFRHGSRDKEEKSGIRKVLAVELFGTGSELER
jgi:hypothetical protein